MSSPSSSEDVALQLLGWSDERAAVSPQLRNDNNLDNLDTFRRAVGILSSKKGQLSFGMECTERSSEMTNPFLVVKGYCRLIKCSLAAGAAVDLTKDAGDLLKNLGNKLNVALQEQIQSNMHKEKHSKQGDLTKKKSSSLRNKVVLFYFKFIEECVYAQINNNVRLLGPTYRSVCEVASSFVALIQAEKKQIDAFVSTFLPSIGWEGLSAVHNDATKLVKMWKDTNSFFERAIHHLLSLLDNQLQKMHQYLAKKQSLPTDASAETTTRVATFLLARITSMVLVVKEFDEQTKAPKIVAAVNEDVSNKNDASALMQNILSRFFTISCLSLMAKADLERCVESKQRAFFEAIVGLGSKAGNSLGKIFYRDVELSNEDSVSTWFECLMEAPADAFNNVIGMRIEKEGGGTTMSLDDLFPLGKLCLANILIGKLVATAEMPQMRNESISPLCETLLFTEVPKCYHLLASGATPFDPASEVLRSFVYILENATHFIKSDGHNAKSCPSAESMHQHHVLVRWMFISQSHPLSNELLLLAIQSRILSSCSADGKHWNEDASKLIALICQLMFHKSTQTIHRQNISILLMRLLSPAADSHASDLAKSLSINMLWREFAEANLLTHSIPFSSNDSRRVRKRKRSQGNTDESFLSSDLQIMCRVLETLASASCTTHLEIGTVAREKTRSLWEGILTGQGTSSGINSEENDYRILLLLSISVGLLRGHSSVANFLRMVGIKVCSSTVFVENILSYIEVHVGSVTSDEIYDSMVFNLYSSLVGVALTLTDLELSECLASRTCNIVKCISTFSVKKLSVEAISLQHSVVSLVCNVGIQIPSGFSNETIQSLAGCISCILEKSSWYHSSPNLSFLECFIKKHPSHLTQFLPASTPTSVKSLLAARVQGKIFSIVDDKAIDTTNDAPYSILYESCFLQERCINERRTILTTSCFGSESVTSCPRCGFCLPHKK